MCNRGVLPGVSMFKLLTNLIKNKKIESLIPSVHITLLIVSASHYFFHLTAPTCDFDFPRTACFLTLVSNCMQNIEFLLDLFQRNLISFIIKQAFGSATSSLEWNMTTK
jgi:hypothetical protein